MKRKTYARKITLFLVEGTPNGRVAAEISNWTGKAYKIPRTMVVQSKDRSDLKGTGVYLLFGKDSEDNKDTVYIGETEEVYKRLCTHLDKKDFWNQAVVIISKDDNLNKAHLKYLESKMYEKAQKVGRYSIDNNNIPKCSIISESDAAEMEEFFDNMVVLISTLGYKIFDVIKQVAPDFDSKKDNIFYIKAARGADAQGQLTSEGFVVFQGSKAAVDEAESFKKPNFQGARNLRHKLIRDNIIKQKDNKFVFSQDYLFSSPSTAAMVVMGRSANGRTEWKTEHGKLLKDVELGI